MSINKIAALPVPSLPDVMLEPLVRMALLEDLGRAGDLTTDTIVPAEARDELRSGSAAADNVNLDRPVQQGFRKDMGVFSHGFLRR